LFRFGGLRPDPVHVQVLEERCHLFERKLRIDTSCAGGERDGTPDGILLVERVNLLSA
jgi:hypothetical protein